MSSDGPLESPKSNNIHVHGEHSVFRGLGVSYIGDEVYLMIHAKQNDTYHFQITLSKDASDFRLVEQTTSIQVAKENEDVSLLDNFHLTKSATGFVLFYEKSIGIEKRACYATAKKLSLFTFQGYIDHWNEVGAVVRAIPIATGFLSIHAKDGRIVLSRSTNLSKWTPLDGKEHVIHDSYSSVDVKHISCIQREGDSYYVWFHFVNPHFSQPVWSVGWFKLQMLDSKIYFSPAQHVWEQPHEWKEAHVYPVGAVSIQDAVVGYWGVAGVGLFSVRYRRHLARGVSTDPEITLVKHASNPMVAPSPTVSWEAFNTLNAAVVQTEDQNVHILYRAQGHDYVSVLGYVRSKDGTTIDYRSPTPAYTPYDDFEKRVPNIQMTKGMNYASGGGYGGVEDPRITIIGDRAHMIYVSYDGYSPPRLALTSIKLEDFLAQRWLWEKPVLISPPGIVDKSGCILPEKINGKYVIFHRIFPNILIDYVDSLEFDGNSWLKGEHVIPIRKNNWDSRKIGAGAPPIKTPYGWLLIYYAVDELDAGRYKIGAMLLDLKDPSKVLHRTNSPILEPTEWYENNGFKPGIAYPCGAVVIGETLYVYYGGSDTYVCVATTNLQDFLNNLRYHEEAHVKASVVHKVFQH